MRVDFLAEQVCSRVPGGTGRYAAQLLSGLVDLVRGDGHVEVRAVTGRPCAAVAEITTDVVSLGVPGPGLARLWERGLPPRLGRAADVVHAPTLLMPPVRHCALVVTVHDVVPWTHPETLTERGVAFHRRMGARAAKHADLIITPTAVVADQVREVLAPRADVVSIPLGVTPLDTPVDAAQRRADLGLGDRPYVLFVGTQEPRKGLDVLIDAMAHADLVEVDLVVAGAPGWGTLDLPALSARAGLGERLHVAGPVTDSDLAALYAGAAALALPSRAEGFGIPVIEAMAHRIPVVISDDPALLETSGGWALSAARGDAEGLALALARAISADAEGEQRVNRGAEHARSLTWSHAAQRTVDAYRTLG